VEYLKHVQGTLNILAAARQRQLVGKVNPELLGTACPVVGAFSRRRWLSAAICANAYFAATAIFGMRVAGQYDARAVKIRQQFADGVEKSYFTEEKMSVTGISSSGFSEYGAQSVQKNQVAQEFQQLGQDLQAGNLSAAQSDFTTLQQLVSQAGSATASLAANSSSQSGNPIAQAFSQLASDLKSGNLTAAQQDFAQIQKDFQNLAAQNQASGDNGAELPHHHHRGGSNSVSQLFEQLGQSLQSGDLTSAQSTFAALQQDLQQLPVGSTTSSSQSAASGVSVSA
jgi:outer membrane protein assembly factor BamD (BamD/ComL family)